MGLLACLQVDSLLWLPRVSFEVVGYPLVVVCGHGCPWEYTNP